MPTGWNSSRMNLVKARRGARASRKDLQRPAHYRLDTSCRLITKAVCD